MNETIPAGPARERRVHRLAAGAILAVYLAVAHGHLSSMDGFLMQRQAYAFVFEHSIRFRTPAWFWNGEPAWNSKFGIGLSLLYVPGMMLASPLASLAPMSAEPPAKKASFYLQQLYENALYTVAGSWVHAVVTALAAYLVGRFVTALGGSLAASLWGMVLYGIGSSALVYSRGDFAQPLAGLCWTAALLAAVRFRREGSTWAVWAASAAVGYAILARPFEGALLVPAVLSLLVPDARAMPTIATPARAVAKLRSLWPALVVLAGAAAAVAVTAIVNWARSGSAAEFGYRLDGVWTMPDAWCVLSMLVGPARGILWEFPAIVLVPFGAIALRRRGRSREALALLLLCAALFVHTSTWRVWWGGWCWGLRLMLPALPLLAVVAASGLDALPLRWRRVVPALLLAAGLAWAVPCVLTDMLSGHNQMTDAAPMAWSWLAWPPYGAWQYLQRVFPVVPHDVGAVDILWFRLTPATGLWSLAVPAALLALAAALAWQCRRELSAAGPEGGETTA